MATETELKLAVQSGDQEKLLAWLTNEYGQPATCSLGNRYFDTPDSALAQAKVALRIRSQDQQHTMTLKTAGQAKGGLHQRQEFDWQVSNQQLDLAVLATIDALTGVELNSLEALFSTDFTRHTWLISHQHSEIELVMDIGQVSANNDTDSILEIELELKSGLAEELFSLAALLARHFPLLINNVSKAQKGQRLLQGAQPLIAHESHQISRQLDGICDALERFGFDQDSTALPVLAAHLANLRLLTLLDAPSLQGDVIELLKLCHGITNILPATVASPTKAMRLNQQYLALINKPELGRLLLNLVQGARNVEATPA